MHRRYTSFPTGFPAIGLLFLRTAVGVRLIVEGWACVAHPRGSSLLWVLGLLALGAGISYVLGFLTPLTTSIFALSYALFWLWHLASADPTTNWLTFNAIVVSISLLFLGPGAISLDAYFFGRRKIVIPRVVRS